MLRNIVHLSTQARDKQTLGTVEIDWQQDEQRLFVCLSAGRDGLEYERGGEQGEKTSLFAPFIYKMHYFTKTGSGQT
jgi:hypothetical protein